MIVTRIEPIETVPVACERSMDYAIAPGSVRLARMHVRRHLEVMGWCGDMEDAALVVSELVSNGVNHGSLPGELLTVRAAVLEDACLLLDVSDPIPVFPNFNEMACPRDDSECGRGLLLIRALGFGLSWFVRQEGKTVRAHFPSGNELTAGDNVLVPLAHQSDTDDDSLVRDLADGTC
nr:ATP-binding protein [Streptomyces sp. NBC_00857]